MAAAVGVSTIKPSRLATALTRAIESEMSGPDRPFRRRALLAARKAILTVTDPVVEYVLDGTSLAMPLSHDLAINRSSYPTYSRNLGQVAAAVRRSRGGDNPLRVIDIGANVADSVAIIAGQTTAAVLCVEGDPVYLPFLEANIASLPGTEIERSYMASADVALETLTVDRSAGTARLAAHGEDPAQGSVRSISEILERHPEFFNADLVKIDTDGHDVGIIRAMAGWAREVQPVLFFEFDPRLTAEVGGVNPTGVFSELAAIGYPKILLYSNFGDFIGEFDSTDPTLGSASAALGSPGEPLYWDAVALPTRDNGLAAHLG